MAIAARFYRRRPRALVVLDVALAFALTAGGLSDVSALGDHAPIGLAVVLCVVCASTVAWRRPAPLAAVLVSTTALWTYEVATRDQRLTFLPYAVPFAYYILGRRAWLTEHRRALTVLVLYGLVTMGITCAAAGGHWVAKAASVWVLYVVLPCAFGAVIARHAAMARELAANTVRLMDAQDLRAARAVGDERNRVARELHDVVAHCVSVMVIQASAAGLVMTDDPVGAGAALRVVETCGRDAMVDLRRIMGVLRRNDDTRDGLVPGLAQLGALVERTRTSGVPTRLRFAGGPRVLVPGVDLVAYRVVQEALTNVVKHAPGSRATVKVGIGSAVVDVVVTNTASGVVGAGLRLPESGHGLTGMRERVAIYGGTLSAGPTPTGGYVVHASVPLEPGGAIRDEPRPETTAGRPVARRWARLRGWVDPGLVGGWLVVLEAEALTSSHTTGPLAFNVVVVAAMALAGLWRRRAPLLFLIVVGLLDIPLSSGLTSGHYATVTGLYGVLIPTYALGAWGKRSRALPGLAVWALGAITIGIVQHSQLSGLAGPLLAAGAAFAVGWAIRVQRDLSANLTTTATQLAAEQEDRARLAVVGERTRIARELHTLVAQAVTTMVVQAEAAQSLIGTEPALARSAAAAIEDTGRDALIQLRHVLGVLRSSDTDRSLRPLPGLDQVHTLIRRAREAGQQIEFSVDGDPDAVFAGVDLITYRIIEEALNSPTRRSATVITVALRFTEENLEVELSAAGPVANDWPTPTMRERVALCAGQLNVAPSDDDAARITIQLPRGLNAAFA
jgi:signal transduction histidine kinase